MQKHVTLRFEELNGEIFAQKNTMADNLSDDNEIKKDIYY